MRHRKSGRKLNRTSSHRNAMFRNMATSLLEKERIVTTDARAKEARRYVERLITVARRSGEVKDIPGESTEAREARVRAHEVASRRRAAAFLRRKDMVQKLFDTLAPRYADRPGGYTRIIKWKRRPGDNALLSILELIPPEGADGGEAEEASA